MHRYLVFFLGGGGVGELGGNILKRGARETGVKSLQTIILLLLHYSQTM